MKSVINDIIQAINESGAVAMGVPRINEILSGFIPKERDLLQSEYERGKADGIIQSKIEVNG